MSSAYHKRAIPCEICGQNFFPSSLPFHQKQCAVKQQFIEVPCPHCDIAVPNYQLNHHIARECKKPSSKFNPLPVSGDGRFPCSVCGRRFAGGDRLVKHQKICRKNSLSRSASSLTVSSSRTTPSPPLTDKNSGWTWSSDWRNRRDEMKLQMRNAKSSPEEPNVEFVLVTKEGQSNMTNETAVHVNVSVDSLEGCYPCEEDSLEIETDDPIKRHSPDSLEEQPGEVFTKREPTAWTIDWDPPTRSLKPLTSSRPSPSITRIHKPDIRLNDENVHPSRTPPKLLLNTLANRGGVNVFNTNRQHSSMRFN